MFRKKHKIRETYSEQNGSRSVKIILFGRKKYCIDLSDIYESEKIKIMSLKCIPIKINAYKISKDVFPLFFPQTRFTVFLHLLTKVNAVHISYYLYKLCTNIRIFNSFKNMLALKLNRQF